MFQQYYVNKQSETNGIHEVHKAECGHLIRMPFTDRKSLGYFDNHESAIKAAIKYYPKSVGCSYCSKKIED